ncbi:MAG: hypothetical protein GAK28_04248 [Luteibacter sp.]|uniref:SGNH/GDSL hydrolase family protein n=1 Tax=Luteibacter sp. TaxID=1886636 RepID=UPI00138567DB|nr:SGNH/GDSL hydrolase family protein [Luteibacter sp.]KAF1004084.1 MAG: hypothetical protein GAK28_04248 [Luteibacter sp.]
MNLRRCVALVFVVLGSGQAAMAGDADTRVATWATGVTDGGAAFHAQSVRMIVHPSISGTAPRLRLSNLRSATPLRVSHATLGVQATGAAIATGSLRPLTVEGKTSFVIPAGEEAWTDPVKMTVTAGHNLVVSLHLPDATAPSTFHLDAFETTYATPSGTGDHAADLGAAAFTLTSPSWYDLSAITVVTPGTDTLVAFGDSITDGYKTPTSANARWPDVLARRLVAAGKPLTAVNAGIGGNRVLTEAPDVVRGVRALNRFDHDVLSLPRVRIVILFEGINDIGNDAGPDGKPLTAADLIDGYRQLIQRAHAAGIRILGATLLPCEGAGYFSESREAIRQDVNTWIRTSGAFDAVLDFDKALRDPTHPRRLRAEYDAGDHLHPNAAGMQAIGGSIDIALLLR